MSSPITLPALPNNNRSNKPSEKIAGFDKEYIFKWIVILVCLFFGLLILVKVFLKFF
jgi:hypothetical protein